MKESDDIGKLFAFFDSGKAKQYHEVHQEDQQRETIERWPLFKQVRVGTQAQPARSSPGLSASAPRSLSGHLPAAAGAMPHAAAVAPIISQPSAGTARLAEPEPVRQPPDSGQGGLKSLFKRLEGSHEAIATTRPAAASTEQASGSIRSLFDRLRRP